MAALKKGLINIDFSGSAFHNRVAYHDFEGVTLEKMSASVLQMTLEIKAF